MSTTFSDEVKKEVGTGTSELLCRNCFKVGGGLFSVPLKTAPGPRFIMSRFKFCSLECQRGYVLYYLQHKNVNAVACLHFYLVTKNKMTLQQIESCHPRDPESVSVCRSVSTNSDGSCSSSWRCKNCSWTTLGSKPFQFSFFEILDAKTIGVAKKEKFPTYPLLFCSPSCALTYLLYSWTAFPWVADLFLHWFSQRFPQEAKPRILQDPEFLTVFTGDPGISMTDYHSEQKIQLVENGGYSQVCMNKYTMKHVIHNVKWEKVDGVEQCTISDITNIGTTVNPDEVLHTKKDQNLGEGCSEGCREETGEKETGEKEEESVQTEVPSGTVLPQRGDAAVQEETRRREYMPVVSFSEGTNPTHPEETTVTPEFFSMPRNQNQILEQDQWRTQHVGRNVHGPAKIPFLKTGEQKVTAADGPNRNGSELSQPQSLPSIEEEEQNDTLIGFLSDEGEDKEEKESKEETGVMDYRKGEMKRAEFLGFDVVTEQEEDTSVCLD
jgi:hypothetical protein